ncbi:MAG: signal peptide peptidase SppA, partial [Candidatus Micrarchaeota archaeon]
IGMDRKKTRAESGEYAPRAPIQLPSSPIWGYALLALMFVFIIIGLSMVVFNSTTLSPLGGECVAIVNVNGQIVADNVPGSIWAEGIAGSEHIAGLVKEADERDDVKAILVVINSPGGSVVGSKEIYRALKESEKPKVAYLREMAASGGYEVAVGTDYIVSEPDALTGSIGARATLSDMTGLFEKIGYNETTFKSGELKDIGNPARPMTEEEKEIMQEIVDEAYRDFEYTVVMERGDRLDTHAFYDRVTDARILTGRQAYEIGLVDELGSKKDAIRVASEMAGKEETLDVCELETYEPSLLELLLMGAMDYVMPPQIQKERWYLEYR